MDPFTFQKSKFTTGNALDLFNLAPTEGAEAAAGNYLLISSNKNQLGDPGVPLRFRIEKGENFTNLRDSFLYMKLKIVRKDGSPLVAEDKVAPSNLLMHSMFKHVSVRINDHETMENNELYPYQAWISKQFSAGIGEKTSKMSKEMYYKDTDPDDFSENNKGFQARMALAKLSTPFEVTGRLCGAMFEQPRYFTNDTVIEISLKRSSDEFCLSAAPNATYTDGYKLEILDAEFYVRKPIVERLTFEQIHRQISKGRSALYPYRNTQVKTYQLRAGTIVYNSEPSAFKALPDFICFGIVPLKSYFGALDKSYNNFKPFDLKKIKLIGGDRPIVYEELDFDYEKGQYAMGYNTICEAFQERDGGNGIALSEYTKGNTLYAFNTSRINQQTFHLDTNGTLRFLLQFGGQGLTEDASLIMICKNQTLMEIEKNNQVSFDI